MFELTSSILSKTVPVSISKMKSKETTAVMRLFLPNPFLNNPLYQSLCTLICATVARTNSRLAKTCITVHICHRAWLVPCPTIWSPMPVVMDRTETGISLRSIKKIRFLLSILIISFVIYLKIKDATPLVDDNFIFTG